MLKVMYALTILNRKSPFRSLYRANQGRNHFDEKDRAQCLLDALTTNPHSIGNLIQMGYDVASMRVDPIFCYDHGDAIGIYVDETPTMDEQTMRHLVAWVNANVRESEMSAQISGTLSQVGMIYRITSYVRENAVPVAEMDWPKLRERVLAQ